MKINTITHKNLRKERKTDVPRAFYNKDQKQHPFIKEREYIRALNATKIDRLLAKPFVSSLTYHKEGICNLVKHNSSELFASSSFDGKTIVWDLKEHRPISEICTEGICKGMSFIEDDLLVSNRDVVLRYDSTYKKEIQKYSVGSNVNCLSYHKDLAVGTDMGAKVFDTIKKTMKSRYGKSPITYITFNTVLDGVMAFGENGNVVLVDGRTDQEFLRINVGLKSNCLQFGPKQGEILAMGNEDNSLYVYDIRYTKKPILTFSQHVNSVISLDFNIYGTRIATGSYDRTIRIFNIKERRCEDIYYGKRMYNVNAVKYTNDSKFIVSGSDDGSIRIWKGESSKKLGPLSRSEEQALNFSKMLKEKFKDVGEINRIKNHRFLPKSLKNQIRIAANRRLSSKRKIMEKKNKELG